MMGSFEARGWEHLAWGAVPIAGGFALAARIHRDLDALGLGETTARSLGVDFPLVRRRAIVAIALLVGTATALVGMIGFLGLVVPHVARRLWGPRHSTLLPLSVLLGAVALLCVDTGLRSATSLVLPPGAVTSALGAPLFLALLWRRR
jgi:iron complex transport system permease protein